MSETTIGDLTFTNEEQEASLRGMIAEARGQLLRCTIIDRLMLRKKLSAKLTTGDMNVDGQNRAQMASLRGTIEHLVAIHSEVQSEIDAAAAAA